MVLKCRGWSRKWRAEQLDPPVIREETAIRHCGPLWNGSIGNWYWQALIKTPFCGKLGNDKIKNEGVSRVSGHSKRVEKCFQIYHIKKIFLHTTCAKWNKRQRNFSLCQVSWIHQSSLPLQTYLLECRCSVHEMHSNTKRPTLLSFA